MQWKRQSKRNASGVVWVDRRGIFAGFGEEVTLDQEPGN